MESCAGKSLPAKQGEATSGSEFKVSGVWSPEGGTHWSKFREGERRLQEGQTGREDEKAEPAEPAGGWLRETGSCFPPER